MADDTQERAEQIFFDALELPSQDQLAFIEKQCGDNDSLRLMVESLLAADRAAGDGNFLESQFLGGAALDPIASDPIDVDQGDPDSSESNEHGRFRIVSRYEQGGLGEVLIAQDRQLNREVAIKQIRPKWLDHEEARDRFIQEAEVTGRLEHPGIVPVYAMGNWDDGRPFYAMRFIRGSTLKKVIADYRESTDSVENQQRTMHLRGLLNRFVDVCNTIEYAHSREIIHRDIKPSNILVGPYGETLVADWGLAKLLDVPLDESMTVGFVASGSGESGSSHTRIGGTVGTPQYMSPEQASGKIDGVGTWTDVYLLGATLYQILTGVPPRNEQSVSKLIERINQGVLTPPCEVDPDVPKPLEAICIKAMATEPGDRYRSASDLAADVERWLADEPVEVFRDPVSVRLGRWMRQHRTLAMSGAVAAFLLTVGSVIGSTLWSYQKNEQFKVERDRNLKESELFASQRQRLNEIGKSAEAAWELSLREIKANRFLAALGILRRSADSLAEESSLGDQRQSVLDRAQRIERIVDFYRMAELSEQFNVMSRDTQGIMAATSSLHSIGVWDKEDWWNHLPGQDLTSEQLDRLRWDVYQQWLMLDGMLVKTIGTRLFGVSNSSEKPRLFSALRNLRSGAGKTEATAALVVSDRIDWFRQSEAARWYRSIANFRLGSGRRLQGDEIGIPHNAPDAQKVGVLCMISAMDPTFRTVFHDYNNQDATTAARDLFQRSASLRPDHYWTQLALGQMQYFIAEQDPEPNWEAYQPAVQTMGRCIAIDPSCCFAFADRSSLFRFQSNRLKVDDRIEEGQRNLRAAELLRWSLKDAQTAYRLGNDQPWVGWTYGMALSDAGQIDEAIQVFTKASLLTLSLMEIGDATLIRADDIRGRSAAAEYAESLILGSPENSEYHTLLATIRLNQERYGDALKHVEESLESEDALPHASAIRGMIHLREGEIKGAAADFAKAQQIEPNHIWAAYGAASCLDAAKNYSDAVPAYQRAFELSTTDEHRAACLLGKSRCLAFLDRFDQSLEAIARALQLQPASDIASVAKPLVERFKALRLEVDDQKTLLPLRDFLASLQKLLSNTRLEFAPVNDRKPFYAPLLNGDFELNGLRYWSDDLGVAWRNLSGYGGTAIVSDTESHRGNSSLQILGSDSESSDQRGSTSQEVPVPENSDCHASVWVKSLGREPASGKSTIHLSFGELATLEIPPGVYDWTKFDVKFTVGEADESTVNIFPLKVSIVSAGPGEVFFDDLQIRSVRK